MNDLAILDDGQWRAFPVPPDAPVGRVINAAGRLVILEGMNYAQNGPWRVREWDGAAWQTLGGEPNGTVRTLVEFQGDLYIGGNFTSVGDVPALRVARWDGAAWHAVGLGLASVNDLMVFDGNLVAAARALDAPFGACMVSRWDGTSWLPLGSGIFQTPLSLVEFRGNLYAAGTFPNLAGLPGNTSLAVLEDGQWRPAAGSPFFYPYDPLVVFNDSLYVLTSHAVIDGVTYPHPVAWNGSTWIPLSDVGSGIDAWWVRDAAVHEGRVYMVGYIRSESTFGNIAAWDGAEWRDPVDIQGGRPSMLRHLGESIIASGTFMRGDSYDCQSLVMKVENEWLCTGLDPYWSIRATALHNDNLIFSGRINGVNAVLSWDGETFQSILPGLNAPGFDYAIASYQGEIFLGGTYTSLPGRNFNGLARWNGTQWQPVPGWPGGTVQHMRVLDETLIVVSEGRVFQWQWSAWSQLGAAFEGEINAIAESEGALHVAGQFPSTPGFPDCHVFRWNGAAWQRLPPTPGPIDYMTGYNGTIVVAGSFSSPVGWQASILRLVNGSWIALDQVIPVLGLTVHEGELVAYGGVRVNDEWLGAFARWGEGTPLIQEQPSPLAQCPGRVARFDVRATGMGSEGNYQWYKDGVALTNGPRSGGSAVWGANEERLLIGPLQAGDEGFYSVVVSSPCAATLSTEAFLTIDPLACCDPDIDCDGLPTPDDAACLERIIGGDSSCSCGPDADFNRDGNLDGFDLEALTNVLGGGPCP